MPVIRYSILDPEVDADSVFRCLANLVTLLRDKQIITYSEIVDVVADVPSVYMDEDDREGQEIRNKE